jgi:diphosphomevalonate decarboxylase
MCYWLREEDFTSFQKMAHVTVTAPINIAFIKYWGKRAGGETLILPTNDSFSITLSTEPFRSKTSVVLTDKIAEDELWLNGKKSDFASTARLTNVLETVRATSPPELAKLKAFIVSENNFPTAAGMASSASGYCALATALVRAFQSTADVSVLSRIGSGSACRSAYGGFVKWLMGKEEDGSDCRAVQYVDHTHWPEMQVLCAVLKGEQKDVSSTKGMQLSLQTSPMMKDRIETIVPARMEEISKAVTERDFEKFAEITMIDSDDLQQVCATTIPKVQYATEDSYAMIRLIHAFNKAKGKRVLAYTFDAGANCFMFTLKENIAEVIAVLLHHFPTADESLCFNDTSLVAAYKAVEVAENCKNLLGDYPKKPFELLLHSPVGNGPQSLDAAESLIDEAALKPK